MTRAPRHTTLADRAAATNPPRDQSRRYLLTGELDQRGVLAVVHATREREARVAARYLASRATDVDGDDTWPADPARRAQMVADCRKLLTACGLIDDDGRDLP